MNFVNPIFFWAFAFLLPLVAVYFLKVRPRRHTTTALFLWQSVYQQQRQESLFNRLRDLLSLLLMALVISLLVLGMTEPRRVRAKEKDLLILVDNSASMAAKNSATSRLEHAKEEARKIIMALGAGRRAAVAGIAGSIEYRTFLSSNQRLLSRAVESIKQSELPFNAKALDDMLLHGVQSDQVRVVLISDGAGPAGSEILEKEDTPIELLKVGRQGENVGIIACDMQIDKIERGRMRFYFRTANSGSEAVEAEMRLYYLGQGGPEEESEHVQYARLEEIEAAGQAYKVIPVTIEPGVNASAIYDVPEVVPGRWVAALDVADALAMDNAAYMTVRQPEPISVRVAARERYFFEHCVDAFAQSGGWITLAAGAAEGDIVVCQSFGEFAAVRETLPEDRYLRAIVFGPAADGTYFEGSGRELAAGSFLVKVLLEDDPSVRFYDLATIPFYGAKELQTRQTAQTIAETDMGTGLIWRLTDGGTDGIFVNMDPGQGSFYYSPCFPVMIYRMALALSGQEDIHIASYQTGSRYAKGGVEPVSEEGKQLKRTGFHKVGQDASDGYAGCSLLAERETLINAEGVDSTIKPIAKGHAMSYWLLLAALAIAAAESMLYHRRKAG